ALGVQTQVIGGPQWLALGLAGCLADYLAIGGKVEHGMLSAVTDKVSSVSENLVAVRRSSLGPDRFGAIRRDAVNGFAGRYVAVGDVIENNSFAVARYLSNLYQLDFVFPGQIWPSPEQQRSQAESDHV